MTKIKSQPMKILLPWFVTKEINKRIEDLLPYYYHLRFRFYFDRYGCVRCECKQVIYGCNGLCLRCVGVITNRLKCTDNALKRIHAKNTDLPSAGFLSRLTSARELLADFRKDS